MGLLRRPTPGEIMEAADQAVPAGQARIRAQCNNTNLRLRRHFRISTRGFCHYLTSDSGRLRVVCGGTNPVLG